MAILVQSALYRLANKNAYKMLLVQFAVMLMYSGIYWMMHKWHYWDAGMFNDGGYLDALYFTVVTHFTVGYGDIVPRTRLLKVVCMSQILVAFILINVI